MANPARVALLLDEAKMNRTRFFAIVLCILITVVDGMDFVAIGIVAPLMMEELGLGAGQFGVILAMTQIGAVIGAVTLGRAADTYGRKLMIVISLCLISVFTLLTAVVTSYGALLTVRFMVGVALTGALPATLALCSELAPRKYRASVLALVVAGFPMGAAIGSIGGGQLALAYSWQSIFVVGAALPLLLALVVYVALPESPSFLARTDYRGIRIASVMRRLVPKVDTAKLWHSVPRRLLMDDDSGGGASVARLFEKGLTRPTLLLWSLLFCSGALSNVTLVWLPTIFAQDGFDIGYAAKVVGAINIGATIGMASAGRLLELIGPRVTVGLSFAIGAIATVGLGQADTIVFSASIGAVMGFFLGITTSSGYALSAILYPSAVRSTGVGAAAAALRIGTIIAPLVVPALLVLALPMASTFIAVAVVPALAAVIAMGFRKNPVAVEVRAKATVLS